MEGFGLVWFWFGLAGVLDNRLWGHLERFGSVWLWLGLAGLGLGTFPEVASHEADELVSGDSLLAEANSNLFLAKQQGRNQVVSGLEG